MGSMRARARWLRLATSAPSVRWVTSVSAISVVDNVHQEPMLKPIKLQCTHLFCEACIAEWFERERTCPMCRAVAKPAGLASFKDASTSLLPQLF